jgi:hypothetical protein
MRHERAVARVIDGFDTVDDFHQLRLMRADMFDQLGLGIGRPGDENSAGIGDRFGDRVEEILIFGRMTRADRIGFVMNMHVWVVGMQDQFLDIVWAEAKNPRLVVIDPDDGMEVMLVHEALLQTAGPAFIRAAICSTAAGYCNTLQRCRALLP